jgi:hypothetical protein
MTAIIAHLVLAAFVAVFLTLLYELYRDTYGVRWPRRAK